MEKRSFPDLHSTPVTGVQVQVQKSSAWTPVIITELVRISLEAQNKPQQLYKTDREECFSLERIMWKGEKEALDKSIWTR